MGQWYDIQAVAFMVHSANMYGNLAYKRKITNFSKENPVQIHTYLCT
jgi:hypothetical protein